MIAKLVVQPDGQPVFYLCKSILGPAWRKYVIAQKKERGIINKVNELKNKKILNFQVLLMLLIFLTEEFIFRLTCYIVITSSSLLLLKTTVTTST